uniref:Glutathione S-transferase C-terminal domain containing n=1 Tax=Chrysemys picta bellii TaxID=8478 RepID=A0A8C3FDW4_CHRPI
MKGGVTEEHLYLAYSHQFEDCIFPLHTSISLFLLSYCDCKLFKVFLVPASDSTDDQLFGKAQPDDLEVHLISRCQLPLVVQSCCLPAIVEENGKFCRAGLSVVLRHIIQKTYEVDPSKKLVLELLGFKKTCLKACAEVFIKKHNKKLLDLPLISSWYHRVQEVPGVKSAAAKCNMLFLQFPDLRSFPDEQLRDFHTIPDDLEEEHEDYQFIGGPRPTMTKLMVVLIENKELSLIRAKDRSDELGLQNIWFVQANLDYFKGTFNIGVALHACGVATDMVIEHCIKAHAAFVICPCCYGFIQNTVKFTFPRSHRFKEVLSYKEHMILCRFADQTAVQLPPERRLIGKHCMGLVDLDRAWAAEGCNYSVQVMSMEPESCSPKNNMEEGAGAGS